MGWVGFVESDFRDGAHGVGVIAHELAHVVSRLAERRRIPGGVIIGPRHRVLTVHHRQEWFCYRLQGLVEAFIRGYRAAPK